MKALPIELKKKWQEAYKTTPNTHKIAKMFNVSQYAVFSYLSKQGILNKPKRIPKEIIEKAIEIYNTEKIGTQQISERLGISAFHLWRILKDKNIARNRVRSMEIAQRRRSKYVQYVDYLYHEKIEENVAWLIGAWMGGGYRSDKSCIAISVKSKEFMAEFAKRFTTAYNTQPNISVIKDLAHIGFWKIRIKTKDISQYYSKITQGGKRIPDEILNDPNNMLSFLSGFLDAEGNVLSKSSARVSYSQKDPFILNQIKSFLKNKLNIESTLNPENDGTHELCIYSINAGMLAGLIKSSIPYKQKALLEASNKKYTNRVSTEDFLNIIYIYVSLSKKDALKFVKERGISKSSIDNWLYEKSVPRIKKIDKNNTKLTLMLNRIMIDNRFQHLGCLLR